MDFQEWNSMPIGGIWREGSSGKYVNNYDPFNGRVLAVHQLANKDDLNTAYETALRIQKEKWMTLSADERSNIMSRAAKILSNRKEEAVELLIKETGSTKLKATIEVNSSISLIQEAASYPLKMEDVRIEDSAVDGKENQIHREPVGVICVITSWNFPLSLSMRSVAPAIATGNGVVIKPATHTPITGGTFIASIFEEAGIPKGLISVVIGAGSEIGDAVVEHPIPKVVSFTGSTEVGKRVGALAGEHLKDVSLELGGNNAFIVLEDADINQAVHAAVFGKYLHQGQICMAINRMIVHQEIYPEFVEKLKEAVLSLKVGDPSDEDTFIGPLIDKYQVDQMRAFVEQAKAEGACTYLEGKVEGNLVYPYIFTNVDNQMEVAQEEIFGPIAVVIQADSEEEAINIANDSKYGLTASIFTSSPERGLRVAKQLDTGMAHINDQTVNSEPAVPFGGEKGSGIGRFGGEWIFDKFTKTRWISVQKQKRTYPVVNKQLHKT